MCLLIKLVFLTDLWFLHQLFSFIEKLFAFAGDRTSPWVYLQSFDLLVSPHCHFNVCFAHRSLAIWITAWFLDVLNVVLSLCRVSWKHRFRLGLMSCSLLSDSKSLSCHTWLPCFQELIGTWDLMGSLKRHFILRSMISVLQI